MLELNKIYNMDCLEGMKQIPDKYFDLVLTDPPYGINIAKNGTVGGNNLGKTKDYGECKWDIQIPSKEVFKEIIRISKNQIIFGGNYFIENLHNSNCWLVWDKNNSGNFADCELAWTSFNTAVRKFTYTWNGMIQQNMKQKEERYHPTQKPISLMEWILLNYSKEGDLICDPFMGSGTTAIACSRLNRKYLGFELVKEYCSIAEKRIKNDSSQIRLLV